MRRVMSGWGAKTAALGVLFALAAGGVAAAHGGDGDQIHACVKVGGKGAGNIRITEPDDSCGAGEEPLDWNITGPAGPQGPAGAQGPAGPQGVPGEDAPVQIAGVVNSDGTVFAGTGFTVEKPATGVYQVVFPAGSFATFPAVTLTPLGAETAISVTGLNGQGDGSFVFAVYSRHEFTHEPHDGGGFTFVVTAT